MCVNGVLYTVPNLHVKNFNISIYCQKPQYLLNEIKYSESAFSSSSVRNYNLLRSKFDRRFFHHDGHFNCIILIAISTAIFISMYIRLRTKALYRKRRG